jgi:hypothetical protein
VRFFSASNRRNAPRRTMMSTVAVAGRPDDSFFFRFVISTTSAEFCRQK